MAHYEQAGIVDMHAGGEDYHPVFTIVNDPRPLPNYPAPALNGALNTNPSMPVIARIRT